MPALTRFWPALLSLLLCLSLCTVLIYHPHAPPTPAPLKPPRLALIPAPPSLPDAQHWREGWTVGAAALTPNGASVIGGWYSPGVSTVKQPEAAYLSGVAAPVYLWDAVTGNLQQILTGPSEVVIALAVSSDGRYLAGCGGLAKPQLMLWELATGRLIWSHPEYASCLSFSPDGQVLAASDGLWDVRTGHLRLRLDPVGVLSVYSPDGNWLVTTDGTRTSRRRTPAELAAVPSGRIVGYRAIGLHTQIRDARTGQVIRTLPFDLTQDAAFSPDSRRLYCLNTIADTPTSLDGSAIRSVDIKTGAVLWAWAKRTPLSGTVPDWNINSITCSSNSHWLACGSISGAVDVLDAGTGHFLKTLAVGSGGGGLSTSGGVAFSSNSRLLVSRGRNTVQVWDTSSLP